MVLKEFVAQRISNLRSEKGISARDLSLTLGLSATYINRVENGKLSPSLEIIEYICEYFHLSVKEFFDSDQSSPVFQKKLIEASSGLQNTQIDTLTEIAKGFKLINNQK